jgi:cytochrome c peroxidase
MVALLVSAVLGACAQDDIGGLDDDGFTEAERAKLAQMSPLPAVSVDPTNKYADDARAAVLGQKLFFEKSYSGALKVGFDSSSSALGAVGEAGKVACASCHVPDTWFQDKRSSPNATSLAVDWTGRNTPSLANVSFYQSYFWDGRADALWNQALGPPEAGGEMAGSRLAIAHMIFKKYRTEYDAIFAPPLDPVLDPASADAARFPAKGKPKGPGEADGPWEAMTAADQDAVNRIYANFGKAIAAYERLLVSRQSPFDKFVAGDSAAISRSAKKGAKLFIGKAGCIACHAGPFFSDHKFHDTGIPQIGEHVPAVDTGRFDGVAKALANEFNTKGKYSDDPSGKPLDGVVQSESDKGRFRTKDLRQIAETGPYMHTGQFATLKDVLLFYNKGGGSDGFSGTKDPLMVPLNLTDTEMNDIVSFLQTLTGGAIPSDLVKDTASP